MKTHFTILLIALSTVAQGQSFYVKTGAGYSFSAAAQNQGINSTELYIRETDPVAGHYVSSLANHYSEVKGSLGAGLTVMGAVGVDLGSNIGVEVRFEYIHGKRYQSSTYNADILDRVVEASSTSTFLRHANSAQVVPMLKFFPDVEGIRPYLAAGPVFATAKVFEEQLYLSNYEGDNFQTFQKAVYTDGVTLGVAGAAGVEARITDRVSIFAELMFTSLSYFPEQVEKVSYEVNNENRLPTLNESQRKTVFVKEFGTDTRNISDRTDLPGRAIRVSFAFNRLAATAGLKFNVFTF